MNILRVENILIGQIRKNIVPLFFLAVIFISFITRTFFFDQISGDCRIYLWWFGQIKDNGGLAALGQEIGDYSVLYMFFFTLLTYLPFEPQVSIKLFSVLFDYIFAAGCALIVYHHFNEDKRKWLYTALIFTTVLMMPATFLNSAAWAQCDSVFASFTVFSIYFFLKEKYSTGIIFFAISLSFKLQAIFFLPVIIILYFTKRKFSIINFLSIPLIMILTAAPAIFMGRTISSIFHVYFNQVDMFKQLTLNFPNIYLFLPDSYDEYSRTGITLTILLLGIMLFYVMYNNYKIRGPILLLFSTWVILTCVLFLPAMHERYSYVANVLIIIYYLMKRKNIVIPIGLNFTAMMVYLSYLYGPSIIDNKILAAINMVLYALLTYYLKTELVAANQLVSDENELIEKKNSQPPETLRSIT